MNESNEAVAKFLADGLAPEIFRADRAYAIAKAIGTNAIAVNSAKGGFGGLIGDVQSFATGNALMAVARLYDPPSKHHPTRSLITLLSSLEGHWECAQTVRARDSAVAILKKRGLHPRKALSMESLSDAKFVQKLARFFRHSIGEEPVKSARFRLTEARNKVFAHNEEVETLRGPTWDGVTLLLDLAKDIVGAIGSAYTHTAYLDEDIYALSADAERSGRAMYRLLDHLDMTRPLTQGVIYPDTGGTMRPRWPSSLEGSV